ncbi:unnamed protein product [Mesocestoides corti]|uniref:RRM domain-containing protein n=1 Tax=Mesocestoides corti TaxID=53468 RepID=A0A0R3U6A4_MESCO|nr:unnamed protein product [Mesocestoides corti]
MQNVVIPPGKEGAEKTARSIFVGNIPYEATEEKLVELFSKAGPVVSFRLVYDRESGKPKGYGFCEYANPAIASSALRNLHNIEFNGRPLRIGPAAGEQNSAEIALTNPSVGPPLENPYGNPVDPAKAPEAISRAVASLPPEQMYELMKQMKLCIQNNPNEARNMLLQNPQLAYALLQAQIVMKIVDPKVAIAMLNRTHDQIPPLRPDTSVLTPSQSQIPPDVIASSNADVGAPPQQQFASAPINGGQFGNQPGNFAHDFPPSIPQEQMASAMDVVGFKSQTRLRNGYPLDMILVYDPLSIAGAPGMYTGFQPPPPPPPPPQQQSAPFQHLQQQQQHLHRPHQPGGTPPQPVPPGLQPATGLPQAPFPMGGLQGGVPPPPPIPPTGIPSLDQMNPAISAAMMGGGGGGSSGGMAVPGLPQKEQEKLDLIMQVLSLSEESIAMLPEDQQRSIRILKEQVRKTGVF